MKILAQTTSTDYKNSKFVGLVEVLEMYTIITAEKTEGCDNKNHIYINPNLTSDLMEAVKMYKQAGGYVEV